MRNIKIKRLQHYNYRTDGYYFVTIVAAKRASIFQGKEIQVEKIFYETTLSMAGVSIDTMIVMSNHVHVIFVLSDSKFLLGEVVRRCKSKVRIALGRLGPFVWQPNYHEHIVRSEEDLNRIREYIILNPEMERLKLEVLRGSR